jgi:hypothetical protein
MGAPGQKGPGVSLSASGLRRGGLSVVAVALLAAGALTVVLVGSASAASSSPSFTSGP